MRPQELEFWLAQNPRTPPVLLGVLGRRALAQGKLFLAQEVAGNPKTPRELFPLLLEGFGEHLYAFMALNPGVPRGILEDLLAKGEKKAVGNPALPRPHLDPGENPWVLAHPETPLDYGEWWRLPQKEKEGAFFALLHNPKALEAEGEDLERLLRTFAGVRGKHAVLYTPHAPLPLRLRALEEDGFLEVTHKPSLLRKVPVGERPAFLEGWMALQGEALRPYLHLLRLPLEEFWGLEGEWEAWKDLAPLRAEEGPIPEPEGLLEGDKREFLLLDPGIPLDLFLILLGDGDGRVRALAEAHPLAGLLCA